MAQAHKLQRVQNLVKGGEMYNVSLTVKVNARGVKKIDSMDIIEPTGITSTNTFRNCIAVFKPNDPALLTMLSTPGQAGTSVKINYQAKITIVQEIDFSIYPPVVHSTGYVVHGFKAV